MTIPEWHVYFMGILDREEENRKRYAEEIKKRNREDKNGDKK